MKKNHSGQTFPKNIYPAGIVKKAARQYAEHISVNVSEDAASMYVEFNVAAAERESVEGEFGNYVLYLTREGRSSK